MKLIKTIVLVTFCTTLLIGTTSCAVFVTPPSAGRQHSVNPTPKNAPSPQHHDNGKHKGHYKNK